MIIDFSQIKPWSSYSRNDLAQVWGYKGYQAIARGVVTPSGDRKIILFVTDEKQESAEQYSNELKGSILSWEGPTDHFAETRMLDARKSGDEIHAFYRARHHSDFTYLGLAELRGSTIRTGKPSSFVFEFPAS